MGKLEAQKEIIEQYTDEDIFELPLFNKKKIDEKTPKPRPFVKWVGGKRNLLRKILPRFPKDFNNYYEPFVGGGAVFFASYDRLNKAFLSDINLELIITYTIIQKNPDLLIEKLKFHASHHSKKHYYEVRSKHFLEDSIELAARFFYLNKTCYNGLYRVNKSGKFNTPMGSYKNPNIVQEENIWACYHALQNVSIQKRDFDTIEPQEGDFVYFDPPYHPTNELSFTEYTKLNFTEQDQIKLRDFAIQLHKQGVYVMLSNSDTRFIKDAYNSKCFHIYTVQAPRYVNCKPNDRGAINELLITTF
jgi:DNA adenine methylase